MIVYDYTPRLVVGGRNLFDVLKSKACAVYNRLEKRDSSALVRQRRGWLVQTGMLDGAEAQRVKAEIKKSTVNLCEELCGLCEMTCAAAE
jgi:hypothetical protein